MALAPGSALHCTPGQNAWARDGVDKLLSVRILCRVNPPVFHGPLSRLLCSLQPNGHYGDNQGPAPPKRWFLGVQRETSRLREKPRPRVSVTRRVLAPESQERRGRTRGTPADLGHGSGFKKQRTGGGRGEDASQPPEHERGQGWRSPARPLLPSPVLPRSRSTSYPSLGSAPRPCSLAQRSANLSEHQNLLEGL